MKMYLTKILIRTTNKKYKKFLLNKIFGADFYKSMRNGKYINIIKD